MHGNHTVIVQFGCAPTRAIVDAFRFRPGSQWRHRSANLGALLVLALALALLAVASNSHAASYTWTNTTGAAFNDPNAWSPTSGPPGHNDAATFALNGTFDVPLTNNYVSNVSTALFGAASSSGTMILTLDFGTNTFTAISGNGNNVSAFVFGQGGTSTVYISCGSLLCTNPTNNARMIVGRQNGPATVFLTNGFVAAGNLVIANNASTANGSKVVISGPNSSWSNSTGCLVGNTSGSAYNSLVISNSGSMVNGGSIQVGNAGFFNSLLVDTGGRLFTGNTGSIGASANSSNNTATVQGGALWDCGGQKLSVGNTSGQNNSLVVGNNGTVSNITFLALAGAGNSLILSGGVLSVSGGITNSSGTVSGFGTIVGNVAFSGTGTLSLGLGTMVGTMTFSNSLTLVSGSTTILKLDNSQVGSNDQVNAVGGITDAGALTVVTNGIAPLNVGDQYQLFVGSQSGSFSTINLPPLDPSKLWDSSQLASAGILAVTFQPVVPGISRPTDQTVLPASTVVISATVTGVPSPGVYWQFNGVNTTDGTQPDGSTNSGSATATLTISNAQTNDSGGYCLIATNSAGAATNCMALTVSPGDVAPSISGMSDQTVIQGNNGTFNPAVVGSPTPTVQWYQNGSLISGATGTPLILTNVQFSQNEFAYSLIASNRAGTATSNATLYVIITPAIQTQPLSLIVTNTQPASFTVVSTNGVPAPTYQWFFNNGAISSATNATYTIASAAPANAGSYNVQVSNAAGSVTSSNATLIVDSTMAVTLTPTNGAVNVCYDTPLFMAFNQAPVLSGTGKVKIYNVTNTATPVDTIDTSLGLLQSRSIGGDGSFNTYPIITNGNTVQIYPHLGVLSSNQQYYVTVDPGIFTDTNGALYAGITTTNGWTFTTKPTGPTNANNLVVAADESGDFATVQGAVDSVPLNNTTHTLINIRNGLYTELVDVTSKNNLTFRGQDRTGTVVGYPNNNSNNGSTRSRMAFKVYANDIAIENMTVTNMTPKTVGGNQAEALTVYNNAKRFILNNAVVASFQDTILINDSAQAYFYKSLITGDTDYIWGYANLFVTNCEIRTVNPAASITQPRTTAGSNGFSFVNCLLTRTSAAVTNTLLARASTGGTAYCDGNVAIINCQIDSNVVGWTAADLGTCPSIRWWEYANTDLDTGAPVTYNGTILTNGDPRLTLASSAPLWLNGWAPQLAPNILTNPVSVTVTAGVTATFSVTATGVPDPLYQWIKDGTNLMGATSATLIVSNPQDGDAGAYSVIVSNGAGSAISSNATLTIVDLPPVAGFSGTPTNGVWPLTVTFTDSSTGTITNRFWDFGDGGTTNTCATNVDYTYTAAGTNTVSLTAYGPVGTSTMTQDVYIVVINPAELVVNPGSLDCGVAPVGQTNSLSFLVGNTGDLSLTGTVSVAAPFVVSSGATYTVSAGASTNVVISFIPTTAGAFVANAIFTSTGGNSTNQVSGVTPGNIGVTPANIDFGILAIGATAQASFVVTNSGGAVISNGTVAVIGGPFAVVSGANFTLPGLGSTNVTVQFAPVVAGAFTNGVAFATANGGAATNTVSGTGVIPPAAQFTGSPTNGTAPLVVTFMDSSTGTITNRVWSFGDGSTTNTTATTTLGHTYTAGGAYVVSLTVFGLGGSNTANRPNYIIVTVPDTTPPQLHIVSPTDYQAFTNATITSSGTASDASGLTDVTVNGVAASLVGSNWSHSVTLALGTNTLTVIATDASAHLNTATQVVHAVFSSGSTPTNVPPQLHIISPTDYQAFTNATITASGTASDASGLTGVTVNGLAASLVGSNWSQSVTLSLGTNTLTVIATDASVHLDTATQVVHAVRNSASTPTNAPPQITTGLTVTNALLQVASNSVVVANETNTLTVVATDPAGNPLAYQWVFGDGVNTNTALGVVDHVYTNDCGPYNARVTVSDGQASTNSDLTVVVACQMQIIKMQAEPNFARTNRDACNLTATIDLPNGFIVAGKSATVDIGGAQVSFTLNAKGRGINTWGTFRLKFNKKADNWTVTATLKKGLWQTPWAAAGLVNAHVPRPGNSVTLTAVVLVDNEAFVADKTLRYTAKAGKSGLAR